MRPRHLLLCVAVIFGSAAQAQDAQTSPLSAIDWLSDSVDIPETRPDTNETPVAESAAAPSVTVTALDDTSLDDVGLLPTDMTGLPGSLWTGTTVPELTALLGELERPKLPAVREFLTIMMLAEAAPPLGASSGDQWFIARVDKLLQQANVESALALLEQADPETPAVFQRYFDVSLLSGAEDEACRLLQRRPSIAPTTTTRIFCLARSGDWAAAALTFNTHRLLGDMSDEEDALLARFLDDEFADEAPELGIPARVTPLVFRMREAIGEPLPTSGLPLAFAVADLRETSGWKTQIDAAERLARANALPAAKLQDIYTERTPSASGGVWDRIDAVQRFEIALRNRDPRAVSRTLPTAWDAMVQIKSEVLFAQLYAQQLDFVQLEGAAGRISENLKLLSNDYEDAALPDDPFLQALAKGRPQEALTTDPDRLAIQAAFNGASPDAQLLELASNNQLGAALLLALLQIEAGLDGDRRGLTEGLAFLRNVGLEDLARRISLQILILDRDT